MSQRTPPKQKSKKAVQATNDSSVASKRCMAEAGYFDDPFLSHFTPKRSRTALINRGYYIRAKAIDHVLTTFLTHNNTQANRIQIVSLGAGFDTSYFRLISQMKLSCCGFKFFEVDFPSVIARKMATIASVPELEAMLLGGVVARGPSITDSLHYAVIGCDLCDLSGLEESLALCGIEFSWPTLLLSECVLTYMQPQRVNELIMWSSTLFRNSVFSSYEQINPSDGFGKVMLQHFASLGSPLRNIDSFPTRELQEERFRSRGWYDTVSCDMGSFYHSLPSCERSRINSLDPFDEFEEWHLKCSHYSLVCALNGDCRRLCDQLLPEDGRVGASKSAASLPSEGVEGGEACRLQQESVLLAPLAMAPSSCTLARHSHASVLLRDGKVLVYGGFGESGRGRPHSRLSSAVVLFPVGQGGSAWTCWELETHGDSPGRRMHPTLTVLPSLDSVLLFGGRESPTTPLGSCLLLHCQDRKGVWSSVAVAPGSECPEARWRHSATCLTLEGREVVVVVGGRSDRARAMADCFTLDTRTWRFFKLPVTLPEGRHSHTAVAWGQSVVIAGGLTAAGEALSSCLQLSFSGEGWSIAEMNFENPMFPRYSMAGCVIDDTLWLVGGVQPSGRAAPGLTKVSLQAKTWREYPLQLNAPQPPVLLHRHSCHYLAGSHTLLVVGGGGNCFSFGTHINLAMTTSRLPYM